MKPYQLLTDKEMVPMGHNEKSTGPVSLGPLAGEIPVEMVVELITPIAMEEGLRFAIREGGRTVGAGVVAKIIE